MAQLGRSLPNAGNSLAQDASPYIIAALTIAALYFGQSLFIPLALAMLLAFALSPGINWLRRRHVPKALAATLMVAFLLTILSSVGALITTQVSSLIDDLPNYEQTLRQKIASLRGLGTPSVSIDRAGETLKKLQDELSDGPKVPSSTQPIAPINSDTRATLPPPGAAGTTVKAVPVEITQPASTPLQQLLSGIGAIAAPLGTAGLVLLFLIFILVERESLRDRLIRILSRDDVERSTTALNDTAARLSKYMSTLLALNVAFGAVIGLGLWIIGVPGAALWGLIAGLMRFVPFIGSIIAGLFPVLLAASVDPGWTMALSTLGLYLVAEPLMGHIIEPVVQGRSTGLSLLAILVATAFWTLLWGPVGLLLAVPLTLLLVSFGRHLEPLAVFSFLLGDEPTLSPSDKFYQRILSNDTEDAFSQAKVHLEDMTLADYYDGIVLGALSQAARDAERRRFDQVRLTAINASVRDVIEMLEDRDDLFGDEPAVETNTADVVCIGARSAIDDAGARVLAHLLSEGGHNVRVVEPGDWLAVKALRPRAICVGGFAAGHRLAFVARMAAKAGRGATIITCQWDDAAIRDVASSPDAATYAGPPATFAASVDAVQKLNLVAPVISAAVDEQTAA